MTGDLRGTRKNWRGNAQRRSQGKNATTICTNVVLISSKLSALSGDTLEVLLGRSVGIANLEEKTLFTDGLTMELSDYLLADLTRLKAVT